jgi:hypothetical protein
MKRALTLLCAAATAALVASPVSADPPNKRICIRTTDIQSMSYPDNRTIMFKMYTGPVKVWRNNLKRECPGLKFERGVVWNIWGNEVCSNMQVFYVINRGTPCMLGDFVPAEMRDKR